MEVSEIENNIISPLLKKKEPPTPEHILKHRVWRNKQINIFYNTGRPIFKNFKDNQHIFISNNNGYTIGMYY